MKRNIFIIVYILVILILIKLMFNTITNGILISKYEEGEYSEQTAYALTLLNFPEGYIADYNCGNILYKKAPNGSVIKNNPSKYLYEYLEAQGVELPKDIFENPIKVKFEDIEVNVPSDCDNYLKIIFGDYMELPPENERIVHNMEIDFGPY